MLAALIAAGLDVNAAAKNGMRPFQVAARAGNLLACQILITNGAALTIPDSYHWSTLHHATDSSHLDIVTALLGAGLDVSAATKITCDHFI